MIKTIDDLFELVKNTFRKKKIQYKYFYNERYWEPIKNILNKNDWKAQKWKVISQKDVKTYMKLPEYFIDGNGNKSKYELNHTIIESIRISTTKDPTLSNICSIALLLGLFQAISCSNHMYDSRIKLGDFIVQGDTNKKLDLILDPLDIKFIDTYLNK